MSKIKFDPALDIDDVLSKMLDDHLSDGGTVEVRCPKCNQLFEAHLGKNECPHCGESVTFGEAD